MVQQLANRGALGYRTSVAVELEHALLDELERERRDEGLGHAGDPETVLLRQRFAGLDVGEPARSFPAEAGPGSNRDDTGQAARDYGTQLGV